MTFPLALKSKSTTELRNTLLLSLVVLIESIQILLVMVWVMHFFPMPEVSALGAQVFRENLGMIWPEREMFYFRFFVVIAILLQFGAFLIFRKQIGKEEFFDRLRPFAICETILLFLLLSALFKTVVYDDRPLLARYAYQVLLVVVILQKIFWFRLKDFCQSLFVFSAQKENQILLVRFAQFLFPIFLFLLLYIPDPEAVLARMFVGDHFNHYDSVIMAPGWAYTSGNILNIDQISQYGLGLPIFFSKVSKLMGGFTYLNTLLILIWGTIVYYLLTYIFLRLWFKSFLFSALAILVGIKIQMFHGGVMPLIFALPSATIFRYPFDILFFLMLLGHLRTNRTMFLFLAAGFAGFGTFYMLTSGISTIIALYGYWLIHMIIPHYRPLIYRSKKDLISMFGYLALGPILVFLLSWASIGEYLFKPEFWSNMNQYVKYFMSGPGAMPIFQSIGEHNYYANIMGLILPSVYVLSIGAVFSLIIFKKIEREALLVLLLSVHGLAQNQYYIMFSAITTYYTTGLPFIYVCTYWLSKAFKFFPVASQKKTGIILIGIALYALFTNHLFISYPNVFNFSRNPMLDHLVSPYIPGRGSYFNHIYRVYDERYKVAKNSAGDTDEQLLTEENFFAHEDLKAYFRKEFDFKEDAQLIADLVPPKQKVPLISSFDVKILMQANRPPFFYHYSMAVSRPMRLRMFALTTGLYTTEYTKRTLDQLENAKPEYLFMERIYLSPTTPKIYRYIMPGLMTVLDYVDENYVPYKTGKYLVAMKRKSPDGEKK